MTLPGMSTPLEPGAARPIGALAMAVERFRREFRASALLSHPNIVAGYDAEQAGDVHFLIMEHVEGTDLARGVAERGPLPPAEACDFAAKFGAGSGVAVNDQDELRSGHG